MTTNKRMMPRKITGLLGNHFFQVAALIGKSGGDWALPPEWETPLLGTMEPDSLLVSRDNCPSIWNATPYLRGPIPMRARKSKDRLMAGGSYLSETNWKGSEQKVKSVLGYNDETKDAAAEYIGDANTACAIHLRRGEKKHLADKYGYPFEVSYIVESLKGMPSGVRVFLFSDEPEWAARCMESIGIRAQSGETGVNHPVEAMARMSACRYLIGANSTMSWWAGYLNQHSDKRIFMPGWRRMDHANCKQITADWPPKSERDNWTLVNAPRKLGIIIAAYKAERFIQDCLQGMRCLEPTPGWEYDIRIGCDGCPDTRRYMDAAGLPYSDSPYNVGAYVIRNSLITQSPCDAYCIFDADDVPMPDFARRSIDSLTDTGVCTCARQEAGERLHDIGIKPYNRCYGRAMFTGEVWSQAGGFRPDRCDSDGDFIFRIQKLGYQVTHTPPPFLMIRRQHGNQLTRAAQTKLGGELRNKIKAEHKRLREAGHLRVWPLTVPLIHVPGSFDSIPAEFPDAPVLRGEGLVGKIDAVIIYKKAVDRHIEKTVDGLRRHAIGLRNIHVIGDDPGVPGVRHIPCDDPLPCREANMIRKVLAACQNTEISDPFLLCADDEILIADIDMESYPLHTSDMNQTGRYAQRVENTRNAVKAQGWPWAYYDGHIPTMIRKAEYVEATSAMPWEAEGAGILCRTPYGCLMAARGAKAVPVANAKHEAASGAFVAAADGPIPAPVRSQRISRRKQRRAAFEER